MLSNELFISCDWGTSNFRLRLVNNSNMQVIKEIKSPDGIASLNKQWQESSDVDRHPKEIFYLEFLKNTLQQWDQLIAKQGIVPIVISGMASSTIGIRELDYATIPYPLTGNAAKAEWIRSTVLPNNPVLLISGVKTEMDVMRGEETQITGLNKILQINDTKQRLIIHPGTHSKHIITESGTIVDFNTYMTGEMFALISKQSILSNSITATKTDGLNDQQKRAFSKGLHASVGNNFLHSLFTVRTNKLFSKLNAEENYFFLSGLLIGEELKAIPPDIIIVLAGETALVELYQVALEELQISNQLVTIADDLMDKALICGQYEILKIHALHE